MTFFEHVKEGLSKSPKKLSSRYFYDKVGDALFQKIMALDEYYLPRFEMEIIRSKSQQIGEDIAKAHKKLQVVELGAGDGSKTKHLLESIGPYFESFEYVALDISPNILEENMQEMKSHLPCLVQKNYPGDYFKTYTELPKYTGGRLVLFLGSNLGNYQQAEAIDFFKFLKSRLTKEDYLLVALDLAKHPRKIIAAYDDNEGITKKFNLNLLNRINRELGGNIDITKFDHFPFYNPLTGVTSSQIISLEKQSIELEDGFTVEFEAYEAIHTEVSRKFFHKDIEDLALNSGMRIANWYYNSSQEYVFTLFQPNE